MKTIAMEAGQMFKVNDKMYSIKIKEEHNHSLLINLQSPSENDYSHGEQDKNSSDGMSDANYRGGPKQDQSEDDISDDDSFDDDFPFLVVQETVLGSRYPNGDFPRGQFEGDVSTRMVNDTPDKGMEKVSVPSEIVPIKLQLLDKVSNLIGCENTFRKDELDRPIIHNLSHVRAHDPLAGEEESSIKHNIPYDKLTQKTNIKHQEVIYDKISGVRNMVKLLNLNVIGLQETKSKCIDASLVRRNSSNPGSVVRIRFRQERVKCSFSISEASTFKDFIAKSGLLDFRWVIVALLALIEKSLPGFDSLVNKSWSEGLYNGTPNIMLKNKLKKLKGDVKEWNYSKRVESSRLKEELKKRIFDWDQKAELGSL
nr:hypothetical protein [Tanacetum cinerariifolium]